MAQPYPGGIEDCSRFQELVEMFEDNEQRDYYYDKALSTVEQEFENNPNSWYSSNELVYGGLMLLLYAWNFAATETKQMEGDRIKEILEENQQQIEAIRDIALLEADLDQRSTVQQTIEQVFPALKDHIGQTGTAKVLSLLNPELFVMWDTAIREAGKQGAAKRGVKYHMKEQGFYEGNLSDFDGDENDYLDYLRYCQQILKDTQHCNFLNKKDEPFAKLLDEALYAYYKIENK